MNFDQQLMSKARQKALEDFNKMVLPLARQIDNLPFFRTRASSGDSSLQWDMKQETAALEGALAAFADKYIELASQIHAADFVTKIFKQIDEKP